MKNAFLFFVLIIIIGIAGCSKPGNNGYTKLHIKPMFGAKQLFLDSTYQSPDNRFYYFNDFEFFISHIKFIKADGSSIEVGQLIYDSAGLAQPRIYPLNNPTGSFVAIQFSIGLDSIQDAVYPSTDSNSPLYVNNGMYWNSSLEYVFVKLSGNGDIVNPAMQSIGYHVGTAPYYRTVTLTKSFSTSDNTQTDLNLNVDVQQLFWGNANRIDITNQSQTVTNTTVNPATAVQFINDFSTIFSFSN